MRRLTVFGAALAVILVLAAPAGGALEVRLSIEPARPAALEPATITLRSYLPVIRSDGSCCRLEPGGSRSYPFRVEAVSPAGKVMRVPVRPTHRNLWRGAVTFPTEGRWTIRAANFAQGGYRPAFGSRPRILVKVGPPRPTPAPAGFGPLGRQGCSPASPARGRELFGTAVGGEQLWAMPVMPGDGAAWARPDRAEFERLVGKETKIVFAATTGRGPLLHAVGPVGTIVEPVCTRGHIGSTWVGIPGHQWGAGFVFPQAGCWRIRVGPRADLWLLVRS